MNTTYLTNFWRTYKSVIYTNCTMPDVPRNSVYFWKNRFFAATVLFLIPLSLIALVPGIYMVYKLSLWGMLFSDFVTVAVILAVAFAPGISVFARKLMFNGALYLTSVVMLHYLGSNGPGLLYLFGVTLFVVVSLDQKYGLGALVLNILICVYFGTAIYYGYASHVLLGEYQLDAWIGVSSNLIFLSGTAVFLIPQLFDGLQSAFEEQDRLREELQDSFNDLHATNEELEQFAYTISHDLKEPLRMIRSFMKLLKNKYSNQLDDKAREYIYYARDGAERMAGNIDDLLEYSRIGRKYTVVKETDLNQLVDDTLQNFQSEVSEKDAEVSVDQLPTLAIVPVAVRMLFQNLVSNALKYQPEENQPIVQIKAEEKEDVWQFAITDNGIGIDPQYHHQIFSIFNRLHARDEHSGSGMGLAICNKIVEQHGGDIWVESETGEGSTFYFTFSKQYITENKQESQSK